MALAHHDPVVRDLPTGDVTFLFSDVEGSTKLLHELGEDRYAEALAAHRRTVREVQLVARDRPPRDSRFGIIPLPPQRRVR
jgi:class 3 adenylate cyclase